MPDIKGMIAVDRLTLHSGDVMLPYTDGIVEATDAKGKMFTEKISLPP